MYGDTEDIKRRKLNAGRTASAQVNVDVMVVCLSCKVIVYTPRSFCWFSFEV